MGGPGHAYLGASTACWALFGEVCAREYADPALMPVHRLTVDAYAAQHPGEPGRRSAQSVWVHLAGLHLLLDRGAPPAYARRVMAALTRRTEPFAWLEPPAAIGAVTVADVLAAPPARHVPAVRGWAEAVWAAWTPHHRAVRAAVLSEAGS